MKKDQRQVSVKNMLENQLIIGVKNTSERQLPLTKEDVARIKTEVATLVRRLAGEKKKKIKKQLKNEEKQEDKWFIDIFAISFSRTKRSDRRKNKGASRKKMRKTRTTTFVKSVVFHAGMMQAYREGRMGISPRYHSFRLRKEENWQF